MKILMLSEPAYPHPRGGAGKCAQLLATELSARGHDVVLLSEADQSHPFSEEVDGVHVVRLPFS